VRLWLLIAHEMDLSLGHMCCLPFNSTVCQQGTLFQILYQPGDCFNQQKPHGGWDPPSWSPLVEAPVPSLEDLRELLPSLPDLVLPLVAPRSPVSRLLDFVPGRAVLLPFLLPVLLLLVAVAASCPPRLSAEAGSQSGCDQASFSSSFR
jgi:hypothetical protein